MRLTPATFVLVIIGLLLLAPVEAWGANSTGRRRIKKLHEDRHGERRPAAGEEPRQPEEPTATLPDGNGGDGCDATTQASGGAGIRPPGDRPPGQRDSGVLTPPSNERSREPGASLPVPALLLATAATALCVGVPVAWRARKRPKSVDPSHTLQV